jgi:phage terminase Nu1 subunit (DNA packaging protein)
MAAATYPLETICKLLDLTPRRVQQLSKEGVIPKAERGRYELVPAVQGYIRYLRDRAVNSDTGGDTYLADRSRLMRINADMAELDLQVKRGELMPVADVTSGLDRAFTVFRARTLAVPSKLSPQIVGVGNIHEIQSVLESEVTELLDELHRFAAGIADRTDPGESGAEAAAEPDGVAVG